MNSEESDKGNPNIVKIGKMLKSVKVGGIKN